MIIMPYLNILNAVGYGNWKAPQDNHWPRDMEKAGSPKHSVAPGRLAAIIQLASPRKKKNKGIYGGAVGGHMW